MDNTIFFINHGIKNVNSPQEREWFSASKDRWGAQHFSPKDCGWPTMNSLGNGAVAANHRLVDDCRGFFVPEYDHHQWAGNLNNQAVFHHGGHPLSKMTIFGWENPLQASKISILRFHFPKQPWLSMLSGIISPLLSGNQPWLAGKSTIHGAFSGTFFSNCGFDTPKIHIHHCVKTIVNHMGCYWIYGVMGFHLHSILYMYKYIHIYGSLCIYTHKISPVIAFLIWCRSLYTHTLIYISYTVENPGGKSVVTTFLCLEVVITCSMDYLIKTWDTKSYKVIQVSGDQKPKGGMVFWWGEFWKKIPRTSGKLT